MCSTKNEVNILIKNALDVALGGLAFWCYGYGLVFGEEPGRKNSEKILIDIP